jgi:cytochrome P450
MLTPPRASDTYVRTPSTTVFTGIRQKGPPVSAPSFHIDVPYVSGLVQLTDYDEIQEVLKSPNFEQGAFDLCGEPLLKEAVNTLHGKEHFDRRRVEAHLFSQAALKQHLTADWAATVDEVLRDRVTGDGTSPGSVELVDMTWRMLCRLAGSIVGIDGLDDPAVLNRLVEYTKVFGQGLTVEWTTGQDADEIIAVTVATRRQFDDEMFGPSLERRRARLEGGAELGEDTRPDLTTLLLSHWQEHWDSEVPLREATLFLVAATQTTVQALPHFIMHLEDWFTEDPTRRANTVDNPEMLTKAAYESLRMFVASPVRLRRAREDVTLKSGRFVAAGERIGLLLQAANQDPRVFGEDADVFNPHRELDTRAPWGLAFGGGPHMCIGRPLVTGAVGPGDRNMQGTMVTVARRLYDLGLTLDPGNPPQLDTATFHHAYSSVPVLVRKPL